MWYIIISYHIISHTIIFALLLLSLLILSLQQLPLLPTALLFIIYNCLVELKHQRPTLPLSLPRCVGHSTSGFHYKPHCHVGWCNQCEPVWVQQCGCEERIEITCSSRCSLEWLGEPYHSHFGRHWGSIWWKCRWWRHQHRLLHHFGHPEFPEAAQIGIHQVQEQGVLVCFGDE